METFCAKNKNPAFRKAHHGQVVAFRRYLVIVEDPIRSDLICSFLFSTTNNLQEGMGDIRDKRQKRKEVTSKTIRTKEEERREEGQKTILQGS